MSTPMGQTLVEMKAGKMTTRAVGTGGKLKVEPDMRRGKLSLVKNNDNTVRLLWTDRTTGTLEDDMLVFPGEQTFEKVETGKGKDRVYLLQFKSQATRRFFFWMQDGDDKKDGPDCAMLAKLLTDAAAVAAARAIGATTGGAGASGGAAGVTAAQQRSLVDMLQTGGAGGAVDPALMNNLNSILQTMGLPLPEESAAPAVAAPATPAPAAAAEAAGESKEASAEDSNAEGKSNEGKDNSGTSPGDEDDFYS